MPRQIDYYFSLQSPWAYIGHKLFREVVSTYDLKVNHKPVVLVDLFSETGGLPLLKRHPVRQRYRMVELQRWRDKRGLNFHLQPANWPFNARLADGLVLAAIEAGEKATLFLPRGEPRSARKAWIAGAVNPSGAVIVDDGAARALQRGTSLLPAGIVAVEGIFERGDAVIIRTRSGIEAGRGLSAYSSADIRRIAGHKSGEIAEILGYRGRDEIIHRDDLVVTEP